jgi:hypothetical protein
MNKKLLSSILALSVMLVNVPSEAAFGHSSSSSSHSYSSPSYSSPSRASSSTNYSRGGISSGQSIGMSRSSVVSSVRDGSYKSTMPSNNTTVAGRNPVNNYNSGSNNYQPNHYNNYPNNYASSYPMANQGHSTGALVGAAVAGGLVGYMLHTDNNGHSYYTNPSNPGVAYNQNGQVMNGIPQGSYQDAGMINGNQQPIYSSPMMAQQPASSGLGWFWWLVIIAAIMGVVYFMFRQKIIEESPVNFAIFKNPEEKIRDEKDQFFIDFQKNNRPSQLGFIKENSDLVFFEAIKDMVLSSQEDKVVSVRRLESELVNLEQEGTTYVASVRYVAEVVESGSTINVDEVWNFKYINNKWLLAGIEQV